jgi:4-amino-4-deoxy-L-arabinose transferase-like glycosyltransferase
MVFARAQWFIRYWINNRRFAIWAACILAFLIRIGIGLAFETYRFRPADDHWAFGYEWARIAKWLLETSMFSLDGSSPSTATDPVYVAIIAAFFRVFGTYTPAAALALITFQSLLCGLTAWAIFVLAEKLYGPIEARLSSLLFACYPASIFFAVSRIAPYSLIIPLIAVLFLVVLALKDTQRLSLAVFGGVILGLSILTSAKVLSLLLVIPLWLFLVGKNQRVRMIFASLVFIGSTALVVFPWSVRNSTVTGQASFSKTNLGVNFWIGNSPGATGYDKKPRVRFDTEAQFFHNALAWIADHPGEFLILTFKRITYFWYMIPKGNQIEDLYNAQLFLLVLSFAALGAFWSREKMENVGLLLLYFAIFPLVFYLTTVAFYRHRYHVEPFVLILTSRGLYGVWTRLANWQVRSTNIDQEVYRSMP